MIWDSKCSPKMYLCALMEKLNKLNTKDKIAKWNSFIDMTCVMCNNYPEDRDHLFFSCQYSKSLWEFFKKKLDIKGIDYCDINNVFEQLANHKQDSKMFTHLINVSITTLIWHIQCERNSRISSNIQTPTDVRANLIIQDYKNLTYHSKVTTEAIKGKEVIYVGIVIIPEPNLETDHQNPAAERSNQHRGAY